MSLFKTASNTSACEPGNCEDHFHFTSEGDLVENNDELEKQRSKVQESSLGVTSSTTSTTVDKATAEDGKKQDLTRFDYDERGFQRIIRNFTPSYVA